MIPEEQDRRKRLEEMRERGMDPYPARVTRTHTLSEVRLTFDTLLESQTSVTVVGRIRTIRKHGGLTFVTLNDGSDTFQLVLRRDNLGEDAYTDFHALTDMGDFLQADGVAFMTKKGEPSIDVRAQNIITKSLLPLPEKWHGLSDVEIRYRQRELDLISSEEVQKIFRTRAKILRTLRNELDAADFMEVETPVLQAAPGGASAKPFITHHNALDADMYLRIAPELYLKRCVVGGFNRVYEVARCFRNEGIDHSHNPEFTQIEGYVAYMDYEKLMDLLEGILVRVIEACGLDPAVVPYKGNELNFSRPWKRVPFRDLVLEHSGIDIEQYSTREEFAEVAMKHGVPVEKSDSVMSIIDNIYKHLARPKIIQPIYVIDYPVEITPLAKRKADNPRYAEMFQLVYGGGVENVKAFTELNDPVDQEERFAEQDAARANGDEEAQFSDHAFLEALKHGMPPTAGFGIGIDRLTATLTDSQSLKEVILFPTLRPQQDV